MIFITLRNKLIFLQVTRFLITAVLCAVLLRGYYKINEHFLLLSHANSLGEIVLKIRQLEESFLLQEAINFQKLKKSIGLAKSKLRELKDERQRMKSKVLIQEMIQELEVYGHDLDLLKNSLTNGVFTPAVFADVKERGEKLSLHMNSLVHAEQNYIQRVINSFAWLVISILIIAILMGLTISIWLWRKLFVPLKDIADATHDIAQDKFTPFPLGNEKDEIHDIYEAINNMSLQIIKQRETLVEAKKLSSIGTLAAGTAHQLNNPLNNISTSCQIALEEAETIGDPKFMKSLLEDIEQEIQRASDTVKGLLEFSRAHQFSLTPVEIRDVINKVLRLIAGEIPSGITVEQETPLHITLLLDSQKMTEALLNIVTNSIQAIDKRPGRILISTKSLPDEEKAKIFIKDNGKGIPKENLRNIFDPFFSTKNSREGTGLGLSVAYGIIKKHNGSITVDSEPGSGTIFTITLPWPKEQQSFNE